MENFLKRPRHRREHRQAPVLQLGLAEGHEGLRRAKTQRIEAVVAGDLGDGRLDRHLHRRARGHVERAGEGIERRGDGEHQGSR